MKKKLFAGLGLLAATMLLSACVTASVAPTSSSSGKIKIAVLSNRGNPSTMEDRQWQWRNEIGEYMETDLIRRLTRCGYEATLIQSASQYVSGPDSYLVSMEITSYNPGSSAARIMVGFGAGACALDMNYTVQKGDKVVQSWKDGIGTSGDWRRMPNALNDKLVRKLNAELPSW